MDKENTLKLYTQTYYVHGMDCASCELAIPQRLMQNENVVSAKASLNENNVDITYKNKSYVLTVNQLNKLFEDLDYKFYDDKPQGRITKFNSNDISITIIVVAIFVALFIVFEKSGILEEYSLSAASSYPAYFLFGFIASISTCAAIIGGLLLAVSKKWQDIYSKDKNKSYIPFTLFISGRLFAFALFGGLLGLLGTVFQISMTFTTILTIGVSIFMIILGLQMIGFEWVNKLNPLNSSIASKYVINESNLTGKYIPFIVGGLTFFIPCGFTLIAQSNALLTGSFIQSSLLMFSFALGTVPMLALISFSSIKLYSNKKLSNVFSLTVGILVILFGIYSIYSQITLIQTPGFNKFNDYSENDEVLGTSTTEIQELKIFASEFFYNPRSINIKANIPTKLIIDSKGTVGCASALYAPGLYDKVVPLQEGINEVLIPNPKKGTYKISCSMGMVEPVTVKVM